MKEVKTLALILALLMIAALAYLVFVEGPRDQAAADAAREKYLGGK